MKKKKETTLASRAFFRADFEADIIRPLAVRLGYIPPDIDVFQLSEADREHFASTSQPDNFSEEAFRDGFVKGTRLPFPLIGPPSKYMALFDQRAEFDALRLQFLLQADPQVRIESFIAQLEYVLHENRNTLSLNQQDEMNVFVAKALEWKECSTGVQEPVDWASRVWVTYLESVQHPDYYFAVEELALIAAQARRNVAIFTSTHKALQYQAGFFGGEGPVVILN